MNDAVETPTLEPIAMANDRVAYGDGSSAERPLAGEGHTLNRVTDRIAGVPLRRRLGIGWAAGFGFSAVLLSVFLYSVAYLLVFGVGIWGINIPIAWGFAIINFVWWIGIGHAGTLISAILYLLHQDWRTSINRIAEAMTLFAVACAAVFPLLHLGRPWFFYWLIPYPSTFQVWPQFRSPLIWDFFAVLTYGTVSLLFWYAGLIPDLASMRDTASNRYAKGAYGLLALGWRNSAKHWRRYREAYLILAGLATPLVVSVHTTVSFDFAVAIVPGWHSTVFPPYFVAGAIFCGFAMVLAIVVPLRVVYGVQDLITDYHLDVSARVMLAAGLGVAYGYTMDWWMAWYKENPNDSYIYFNDFHGPYALEYWLLILCNVAIPQLLWLRAVRRRPWALFLIAMAINVGMWLERLIIIALSLHRDHLPSTWEMYYPTIWDWSLYLGTFGLFGSLLFVFLRLFPMISIAEVRELVVKEDS
jgi:molybdopterin-containing oxidoreductase family membrane subunit